MNLEVFLQGARNILGSVTRTLRTNHSVESIRQCQARLESLNRNVRRVCISFPACETLLPDIQEAIRIVQLMQRNQNNSERDRPPVQRGNRGRPEYVILPVQLELLLELRFTNKDIATMLHVSESVIKRRLREFGLTRRQMFSTVSDDELDELVRRITDGNPFLGQRNVLGQLQAQGYVVQRQRVADSLVRVDPAAVAMRWSQTINRRAYSVLGPNALWHIDGNHKLIRWGFVIHGGIDGYSRLMVFLRAATNNRAGTVMDSFLEATHKFGVPSRVRCDHGMENMDVAAFMIAYRGDNRGSCITGRSVHNQRIERFWRDLFLGCTNVYKHLFEQLQDEEVLSPRKIIDVWCLQYAFLPRLNRALTRFADGWNHHRMVTAGGKSPLQMYTQGLIENRGHGQTGVEDLFFEPQTTNEQVGDDYGVDWGGPVPEDNYENELTMPDVECPLNVQQLQAFKEHINPLDESHDGLGIDIYLRAVDFCISHLQ